MKLQKVTLCKLDWDYCPTVEQLEDGRIRIGEAPEFAYLSQEQWNLLVDNIESKKLTRV